MPAQLQINQIAQIIDATIADDEKIKSIVTKKLGKIGVAIRASTTITKIPLNLGIV